MPETRLCNDHSLKLEPSFLEKPFVFLSRFSFIFLHFLTSQTPSEDDNIEDEWLNSLLP